MRSAKPGAGFASDRALTYLMQDDLGYQCRIDSRWNFGGEKRTLRAMATPRKSLDALTLQLLTWVAAKPRTYADAMGAWRTSCPRMPIWEDAIGDGLIRLEKGGAMKDALVILTERGRAGLAEASAPANAPVRRASHRILHEA